MQLNGKRTAAMSELKIQKQIDALTEQLEGVANANPNVPDGEIGSVRAEWGRARAAWERISIMVESYLRTGKVSDLYDPSYQGKPSIFDKDND